MSVWRVDNTNSSGVAAASLIRRFKTWTFIYIQNHATVAGGHPAIRISTDRSSLENLTGLGSTGGIHIVDVMFEGWWIGDLWAIADIAAAQPAEFNLEVMQAPIVTPAYIPGDVEAQAIATRGAE